MVCTYKLFTSYMLWRTHIGERAPLWCTYLIFTIAFGQCFVPRVVVYQKTHYTQDIHYNISSGRIIHNSPSGYMDNGGWHKSMSCFPSICFSSPLNPQVFFYDGHGRYFDDRSLDMLRKHNIQSLILKAGDSVHGHPNYNGPNMKLNNSYNNSRRNWMRHHVTLKFTPAHMNYYLVATCKAFKIASATITHNYFKKTHNPPPPSTPNRHN